MGESTPDFKEILKVLVAHGVEFVVIGGVGAVLQGAPIATFDLDIVHARSEQNLDRLLTALQVLRSVYRSSSRRELCPTRSHLKTVGHQLLMTEFGPLDVLGSAGAERNYSELIDKSEVFELEDLRVHVLNLETLIQLKEETGHEKDRAVLSILQAVLEEKRGR